MQFACAAHLLEMSRFGAAFDNVTLKPESVVVLGGEVIWVVGVSANGNDITHHTETDARIKISNNQQKIHM